MRQEKQDNPMIPILAAAAIQNGGGNNEASEMLNLLIREEMEKRNKERDKRLALAEQGARRSKENREHKLAEQNRCSHRKQDGSTRLRGQRLSGTDQINLVCMFCHKCFYAPPLPGQEDVPKELWPTPDEIGG